MISKSSLHAVRALSALAMLPPDTYKGAAALAEEIGAPKNYLGKLLQQLAQAELVRSQKGLGGGFALARDPASITLYDVVEPIDHVSRWMHCFLGGKECSDQTACVIHFHWLTVRSTFMRFLSSIRIADLIGKDVRTIFHIDT